jgi:hypothetical protein
MNETYVEVVMKHWLHCVIVENNFFLWMQNVELFLVQWKFVLEEVVVATFQHAI